MSVPSHPTTAAARHRSSASTGAAVLSDAGDPAAAPAPAGRWRRVAAAVVLLGPLAGLAHDGHGGIGTWHLHPESLWPLALLAGVVALVGLLRGPRK